eukprot:1140025-Pelagomonas_calceolata.AAC.1
MLKGLEVVGSDQWDRVHNYTSLRGQLVLDVESHCNTSSHNTGEILPWHDNIFVTRLTHTSIPSSISDEGALPGGSRLFDPSNPHKSSSLPLLMKQAHVSMACLASVNVTLSRH